MSSDHPERPGRLALSTSLQDFGFPQSSSALSSPALSVMTFDFDEPFPNTQTSVESTPNDPTTPFMRRMGRQNLLAVRTGSLGDLTSKTHSPLRTSYSRRSIANDFGFGPDESDSEREREREKKYRTRHSGSSPSSGSDLPTPPLAMESDGQIKTNMIIPSSTRQTSVSSIGSSTTSDSDQRHARRLSQSVRPPRLLSLISESNPAENEVKSEAQFQRMFASYKTMPGNRPKTSGALSDRGRYPEEAGDEDAEGRDDTPSEDDDVASLTAVGSFNGSTMQSQTHINLNLLEDAPMLESFRNSPAGSASCMEIDMIPPMSNMSSSSSSMNNMSASPLGTSSSPITWRETPPPTARPNKRKQHEDRYDPYPNTAKRRAVSPSIASLRDSLSHVVSMPIPIPVPRSPVVRSGPSASVASSPGAGPVTPFAYGISSSSMGLTNMGNGLPSSRPMSAVSSPIISSPQHRSMPLLSSPILRPMPRLAGSTPIGEKAMERELREVEGAGEAVGSLTLTN